MHRSLYQAGGGLHHPIERLRITLLLARMLRAARMDGSLYVELRNDPIALAQGLIVLALASIATAVGIALSEIFSGRGEIVGGIVQGLAIVPGMWAVQTASALFLGSISGEPGVERPSRLSLLAALCYSSAPGLLLVLVSIPLFGAVLALMVTLLMVMSMAVAVQGTMDVSLMRGIIAVAPGFLISRFLFLWRAGPS